MPDDKSRPNAPLPPSHPVDASSPDGYGYGYGRPGAGYGGYGYYGGNYGYYGGGYGGDQDGMSGGQSSRTFQDYLVMIRERFWYLVLSVFVCLASMMIYTVNETPEWEAAAQLRVERGVYSPVDARSGAVTDPSANVLNTEDFMTQVGLMRTTDLIQQVSQRLTQDEKKEVLEPYQDGNIFTGRLRDEDVIGKCYSVRPQRGTLMARISYVHPRKEISLRLTQLFTEEILKNNQNERYATASPLLERMGVQIKTMEDQIADLRRKRTDLVDSKGLLTVTARVDTARAELNSLNNQMVMTRQRFEEVEVLWKQLQELKKAGLLSTKLSVISTNARVMQMENSVAGLQIEVSGAQQTFTEQHPKMVELLQKLNQAKAERTAAIGVAESAIEQEYFSTKANFEAAKERVAEKEKQMIALNADLNQLDILDREIREKEDLRAGLNKTYEAEKIKIQGAAAANIKVVESATMTSNRPVNQNYWLNGAIGIAGGVFLGCGIIFILAFMDDRVKSAHDIEVYLGLPLIGILPIARRMDSFKKARVVANGADRPVVEGFRSIYSALKINELAKNAKTFLTTSTMPSEGKSFVTTNLAMTFALHGERVIVIDADLRMPAVGKTLQLEGDKGITRYLQGQMSLDEAIYHDVVPNFDVLPVGALCKNPTQVLNSQKLADMIEELKGRYDRVFIDSPPVGAVSDSLNLLPQVDGVVYVVRFNTVKRRFIKSNVRRLQESKVPIYGAVLNQIGMRVARYYTNSGDKAYSKYYGSIPDSAEEVNVS